MTALQPATPDTLASFSAAVIDDWANLGATVAGRFRAGQYLPGRGSAVRVGTPAVPSPIAGVDPDSL